MSVSEEKRYLDEEIRVSLRELQQAADGVAPDFQRVFRAAEQGAAQPEGTTPPRAGRRLSRQRVAVGGGAAIAATIVVAALFMQLQTVETPVFTYVDIEELSTSTRWSAPSDVLLPSHQFDLYRELPELFESTKPDEGALL